MRVVYCNLAISLGYNLFAATLAAGGWMSPLIAAIIMPISSATALGVAVACISPRNKQIPTTGATESDQPGAKPWK
jgi:cation transport ATPase